MGQSLGRFTLDGQARLEGRPATLGKIPDGVAGIRASVALMCRVVRRYKSHPRIRELAVSLTNHLPDRAWYQEANALFDFTRDKIRYVFDPVEVEYVMAPDVLLDTGAGDCDDKSTLFACLLASIGHPSRFVVCGFESRGVYEHVYVETLIGERWIPGDCTQEFPFGWSPPDPLSVMRFHT